MAGKVINAEETQEERILFWEVPEIISRDLQ
jgi:hypothetical protein